MSSALTADDVWKMFQETNRLFQEAKRESEEFKRENQEFKRETQEFKRETQEFKRETQEFKREFQESLQASQAEWRQQRQETERMLQEERLKTEHAFRETDQIIKKMSKNIDRLGGRLGEFVEGLVAPACKTLFVQRGIPVHKVTRRVDADLPGGRYMEIDLLVINTDAIALVEVKSKLAVEDVREHLSRLAEFKEFFPEYADKQVMGAVAAMVIEENVCRFAISSGLFVIEQAGDTLRMANDMAFQPKVW
ncbi:MAG: hypothetical protein H7836_01270 [Magnetococcus sp. YQC-3]